jgi:hypothetical protein
MPLSIFSHLPHYCYRQGGSGGSFLLPLSIMFSLLPHLCCRKGDQEANVLCHLQYSVIYHTFAVGRGFMGLIFFATFKNVSVIFHSFAVGRGVQEAHGFCHFQYCFSYLPHMCYRQRGSGCSCLLPLSIMFQSFTIRVL